VHKVEASVRAAGLPALLFHRRHTRRPRGTLGSGRSPSAGGSPAPGSSPARWRRSAKAPRLSRRTRQARPAPRDCRPVSVRLRATLSPSGHKRLRAACDLRTRMTTLDPRPRSGRFPAFAVPFHGRCSVLCPGILTRVEWPSA
jgi:hypothetical protein